VRTGTAQLVLFSCGFFGPCFINKRPNDGDRRFNVSKGATSEREISRVGVNFDSIVFHNAIQRLSADYAMEPGATDGTLSIRVEEVYSPHSEGLNFFAIIDAGVEIDPAVAKSVHAYLSIKSHDQ
jgi:hypothetical protein